MRANLKKIELNTQEIEYHLNSKPQTQIRCFYTLRVVQAGNSWQNLKPGEVDVLLPTQSREEKATETIVHFKQKEYCGSRTASAPILSERKVHVKAAK